MTSPETRSRADFEAGVVVTVDVGLLELASGARVVAHGDVDVFVPARMADRVLERGPCAVLGAVDTIAVGATLVSGTVLTVLDARDPRVRAETVATQPVAALLCHDETTEFLFVPTRVVASGIFERDAGGVRVDDATLPSLDVAGLYGRVFTLLTRREIAEDRKP